MIVPTWWAVVHSTQQNLNNQHAPESDVLAVNEWTGVRRLIAGLDTLPGPWTWDVYDHRGDLVISSDGHTIAPNTGKPVKMTEPMAEGRYRCVTTNDFESYSFERVDAPPTPQLVAWIATPEPGPRADVLVTPYDMDPNPVSIAMRLRKRIYDEKFARENPGWKR